MDANFPNQIPAPPIDMVMPQTANFWFTVATFSILFVFAIILTLESRREKSALPILFLIGGMIGVVTEPFFDIMVGAWYPRIGATPIVQAFNVGVPLWLIAPWGFYIGGQAYYVYRSFNRGMSAKTLWVLFPFFWFTNVAFEIPGLLLGVYTYYGPQAFEVFGFPLWMGMSNAIMPVSIAAAIFLLKDHLTGPKVLLAVPIIPLTGLASGAVVGFPMWWALNSGGGIQATQFATLIVFLIACLLLFIYAQTVCRQPDGIGANAKLNPGAMGADGLVT